MADAHDDTIAFAEDPEALSSFAVGKWKVLVVDDEPEVHDVTALALKGVSFHLVRIVVGFGDLVGTRRANASMGP